MNTVGRRLQINEFDNYLEDQLIKDLVDNSKNYEIKYYKNSYDKSIKMASILTKQYVNTVRKWDSNFCNSLICKIFEI